MLRLIEIVIDTIIVWIVEYLAGRILLKDSNKSTIEKVLLIITFSICLSIVNYFNFEIFHGIIKIFTVYLLQTLFYMKMFDQNLSKSMLISLIWYLCISASEVINVIIISIITWIIQQPMQFIKYNLVINSIIVIFSLFIVYIFRNKFKTFITNYSTLKNSNLLVNIIILITMALLLFKIPFNDWSLNKEFLVTMLIILCFNIIGIILIKQRSDIQKTTSMYQQVVKYSNTTNKVLEDYRIIGHEHKNQLSIIRQMILKNKEEAIEYIDSLISKRNDIKYKWVAELNNLPLEGLKGLINYKLIEAKENNIEITVIISKEVLKVKLNKLSSIQKDHLYSICGVYLDNAIQASMKSKLKELNIEAYKENKELVFIISNTFKGKVALDKMGNYGYTTKGKNHGVGLHIVKTIMDEDKLFTQSRKVIDNYYIQELRINMNCLSKKKK